MIDTQATSVAEGKKAPPQSRFKRCLIWVYVATRAICRFLFVDIGGSGYFEKDFTPSSQTWNEFEFQGETERERGRDAPLFEVVGILFLLIVFCWLWIPVMLCFLGWEAFKKWIGDV